MDCYLCLDKNLMNTDESERWTLVLIFKSSWAIPMKVSGVKIHWCNCIFERDVGGSFLLTLVTWCVCSWTLHGIQRDPWRDAPKSLSTKISACHCYHLEPQDMCEIVQEGNGDRMRHTVERKGILSQVTTLIRTSNLTVLIYSLSAYPGEVL